VTGSQRLRLTSDSRASSASPAADRRSTSDVSSRQRASARARPDCASCSRPSRSASSASASCSRAAGLRARAARQSPRAPDRAAMARVPSLRSGQALKDAMSPSGLAYSPSRRPSLRSGQAFSARPKWNPGPSFSCRRWIRRGGDDARWPDHLPRLVCLAKEG